jgi:hypothetical protein
LEKGMKNPTPLPPFVIASSRPWESSERKRNPKAREKEKRRQGIASRQANSAANTIEWVNPRCPIGLSYGMP